MTASHAAGGARPVAAAAAAARGASPSIGPGKITTRGQEEGGPAWGATASRVVAVVPHRRLATWGAGSRRRRASLCSRCCAPPDRRGDPKANPPPHALCGLCLWWAPHGLPRSPGHHALFLERRVPPLPPRRPPNFSATAPAQLPCGVRRGGRPPRGVSGWQPAGEWARGGVRGVGPTPPQTDPSSGGAVGGGGGGGVCWRRARWARRWRAAAPKTRPLRATRVRSCGGPASTGSPVACGGGRWGGTRGSPPIASNGPGGGGEVPVVTHTLAPPLVPPPAGRHEAWSGTPSGGVGPWRCARFWQWPHRLPSSPPPLRPVACQQAPRAATHPLFSKPPAAANPPLPPLPRCPPVAPHRRPLLLGRQGRTARQTLWPRAAPARSRHHCPLFNPERGGGGSRRAVPPPSHPPNRVHLSKTFLVLSLPHLLPPPPFPPFPPLLPSPLSFPPLPPIAERRLTQGGLPFVLLSPH